MTNFHHKSTLPPYFDMVEVERLLNSLEILDKFGIQLEKMRLVKGGTEINACCPFHAERKPSFFLNVDKLVYKCFGCQAAGHINDVIAAYSNLTSSDIKEALQGDIPRHYQQQKPKKENGRYMSDVEIDILTQYVSGFHTLLKNTHGLKISGLKDVSQWQRYLTETRGLSWEAIDYFKLGANALRDYNKYFISNTRHHYGSVNLREVLSDLNLVNQRGSDYYYSDSPAVIIPYWYDGQVYYVNARILPGKTDQRYKNISGIAREMLFNEDAIDQYDSIYLVEGEFNAMSMWDSGFKNVASFGGKGNIVRCADKCYGKDVILYVDNDKSDPEFKTRTDGINALLECAKSVSYFELSQGIDINDYLKIHTKDEFEDNILSNITHVDSNEFLPGEYSEIPEGERKKIISLSDAQFINAEYMEHIAKNLPAYSGKRILNNMPIGTAKTTGAKKLVIQRDDPTLIMTSTHYLATDYDEAIDFQNERFTVHLKGRGHKDINCQYAAIGDYWSAKGYGLFFKLAYCMGKCEKGNDCEHLQLLKAARSAPVLIATHAHGQLKEFFTSPYWGNNKRNVIIIDEEAELVKSIYLNYDVIQFNTGLFEKARNLLVSNGGSGGLTQEQTAGIAADGLVSMLKEMESARLDRHGYIPKMQKFTKNEVWNIDKAICLHIKESGIKFKERNVLHDLVYVINNGLEFKYDKRRDSLYFIWRAVFPSRACVIFLTGTTPKEYIEKSLNIHIDEVVGQQYYVQRGNTQVVQMLNVTGGRQRLLFDTKLQQNIIEFFKLALEKHRDQKIMIVTSQGAGAEPEDTAKQKVIRLLAETAGQFNRSLVAIETADLEAGFLPLSNHETDIPVIHYGIQGTNLFSDYEILIELNAHYYNQQAIIEGVRRCFDVDVTSHIPVKKQETFRTLDKIFHIEKYTYGVDEVDLYIEANQKADIIQAEGRILRGEDTPKIIYRLHNVNIEPYPNKIYKSWDSLLKGEFGIMQLTGKLESVFNWIQENVQIGQEFTTKEVAEAMGGYVWALNKRYLTKIEAIGDIINIASGKNVLTRWKRLK